MEAHSPLVMLPRDAPTDVLNELQLVQDFYGADAPSDHQRVMALFAPNAQLDLPQMFVAGRDYISAVMFYAKTFIADIDIEPYMVEVAVAGSPGQQHHTTATTSTAPTSSTTSTDSTSSTCTSAATSRRRRPGGKPPKAPSAGAAGPSCGAAAGGGTSRQQQPSRLGRKQAASSPQPGGTQHHSGDVLRQPRHRGVSSDLTDQLDGTIAQNGSRNAVPASMSRTHVYAVATITPKSLPRLLTLNLLPREIHLRTRVTLVWDDEAGEVLLLQERPDNLPVGLVPGALKRAVGSLLGYASSRSQWLLGRLTRTRLLAGRWPGLAALHGTGI